MKRRLSLVAFLLVLSGIAGYLLSKASLVGRVGISLFYTQYKFLKTWWQGGLVIFIVWMILFFLQGLAKRKYAPLTSRMIQAGSIVIALIGLYFTYQDFRQNLSHRWLGERFHLGAYLFWIGWIIISVFYLTEGRMTPATANQFPENDFSEAQDESSL